MVLLDFKNYCVLFFFVSFVSVWLSAMYVQAPAETRVMLDRPARIPEQWLLYPVTSSQAPKGQIWSTDWSDTKVI